MSPPVSGVGDWPDPPDYAADEAARNAESPPPRGFAWSLAYDVDGSRLPEHDRLVVVYNPLRSSSGPQLGDLVHYVSHGSASGEYRSTCRAAQLTEVGGNEVVPARGTSASLFVDVGLVVVNPSGLFFRSLADGGITHDPGRTSDGPAVPPGSPYVAPPWVHRPGTWHFPSECDRRTLR